MLVLINQATGAETPVFTGRVSEADIATAKRLGKTQIDPETLAEVEPKAGHTLQLVHVPDLGPTEVLVEWQAAGSRRPNIYAQLPKIIRIVTMDDSGEYGAATCPHCGALGRYVYTFDCEDGTRRGAMRGCLKKFPIHRFAQVAADLMAKEKDFRAKGWNLPRYDQQVLTAIDQFAAGMAAEQDVDRAINQAKAARAAIAKKRRGR